MSLENSQNMPSKFSHRPMIDLAGFLSTRNGPESQVFAQADADVATTGTKTAVLNGLPIVVAADAALDISADLQLTVWLTATAYTAVDLRYVEDDNGLKQWYKCTASHTSSTLTKPGAGSAWRDYWTLSSQTAENASGWAIASGDSAYVLALVNSAGTLTMVKASDDGVADADIELKIPNFDPEVFIAIGLNLINSTGVVYGTDDVGAAMSTVTQLYGSVLPHADNIDKN